MWGVPTTEIRAEWAAQRIKGLSFFAAAKSAFFGNRGNKIKSLISEFNYPRYGPGQMWEQMPDDIRANGGEVRLNAPVTKLVTTATGRVVEVVAGGETLTPSLRDLLAAAAHDRRHHLARRAGRGPRRRPRPALPRVPHRAAGDRGRGPVPRQLDLHPRPGVEVGRIQNFKSWSPWMVPNDHDASIGMEYFCFEGDELWTMDDEKLVKFATREIQQLGLAQAEKVKFGFVARVHKAYPIYDAEYAERVATIRGWLATVPNLIQVGRNGLHRYNNSDHSMLTAMRAVDNILLGLQPRHLGGQRRERLPRGAPGARAAVHQSAGHLVRWSSRSPERAVCGAGR